MARFTKTSRTLANTILKENNLTTQKCRSVKKTYAVSLDQESRKQNQKKYLCRICRIAETPVALKITRTDIIYSIVFNSILPNVFVNYILP